MIAVGIVTIHGTISTNPSDQIGSVVATGATGTFNTNLVAGTFTFTFDAIGGNSYNLGFRTQDYAGNLSSSVPFVVITHSFLAMSGFVGAGAGAVNSANQLTASAGAPVSAAPATSSTSGNHLYVGIPAAISGGP